MVYLSYDQLISLYTKVIANSGGMPGIRDQGAIESALAQPQQTFGGVELYATLHEKAAALGYSLIQNHPFTDGNKRIGHAAIEAFLIINGFELECSIDMQEQVILSIASSTMDRDSFCSWIESYMKQIPRST